MLDFINVNLQRLNNNTIVFQNLPGFFKFVRVASNKCYSFRHKIIIAPLILGFLFQRSKKLTNSIDWFEQAVCLGVLIWR